MGCPIGQNSLFGVSDNYIKFQAGDAIAVENAQTVERQILNDLRFPYKQLLRGRIILKPGQVNYLMNHLGMGDNATFVSISARYDSRSKIEEDNYVQWSFYPDLAKIYYLSQMLLLTGNSTHRVPQIYLTNPNANYPVTLDVMVASIDDTYNYFSDVVNQTGLSFTNLLYTDIETYIPNQSIVVLDRYREPLAYINDVSISSIYRSGLIVSIQEITLGKIFLEFQNEYNAKQAYSMLNYIWRNQNAIPPIVIVQNYPYVDNLAPVVYFYENVGNTSSTATIDLIGSTYSGPYNTSQGSSFSTTISLSQSGLTHGGYVNVLTREDVGNLLISSIVDDKDGTMSWIYSDLIITDSYNLRVDPITVTGTYSLTFDIQDFAGNFVNASVSLNITT